MIPNRLPEAIEFAMTQPQVKAAMELRAKNNLPPLGLNCRVVRIPKHDRNYIRITLDYVQPANPHIKEDIIIWLHWDDQRFYLNKVNSFHEVDGPAPF